ncbi:hypothetical protein OR1_00950 [Geobacter sp. OR-1]|uniref:hypothetical protein n=1 Tax=Geobacter sp. OR-1 TaxID=1266765 RepID=UPI000543D51D|nr:hypothetical protein [Geobacter sp. OR-1]GAM08677.1 hypothetical protein OR1_00950 [Geobacter sp. OR-1]
MSKARTIAEHVTVAAVISILLIWGNTQYRQWYQYSKGEEAMAKGDAIAAIAAYEASLHMYTPLSPLIGRSAERLWNLGQELEQRDPRKALLAYRALRSSFYAVRSLYSPGTEWIKRCDDRIALLVNTTPAGR